MKFLHKSIIVIVIVSLVVILICYDIHKTRTNQIENFANEFQSTIITEFSPNEGDSSTMVTIKGRGLEYIEEVLFKDVECVILENRNSQKIQIIPPALSEVGMTIEEIRKKIDETGSGMPVQVKLMKKKGGKTLETAVLLPDVVFTYVDKGADWKNSCPKEEEEEEIIITDAPALEPMVDTSEGTSEFKEGTDLYFLHVTLPQMEEKLQKILKEMEDKLAEHKKNSPELNNVNSLKIIQSMDSLLRYQEEMNILRFNIHKNIKDTYG